MKTEEKISRILENEETCSYRIEKAIASVSNPEAPLSNDMAKWMRQIGIEDPRIEMALDEVLSAEAREEMLRRLMDRYCLNNRATAALLGCSVPAIASYRTGRNPVPLRRLMQLRRIIDAIDQARSERSFRQITAI